jgi:hypothetical protein
MRLLGAYLCSSKRSGANWQQNQGSMLFSLFSAIFNHFRQKMAHSWKLYDPFCYLKSSNLRINHQYLLQLFWRNYLQIITSVPAHANPIFFSTCLRWFCCSSSLGSTQTMYGLNLLAQQLVFKNGVQGDRGPMLWFFKIFPPKNSAKKLAFLTQNKAKFWS